jgi:transcriptional regulator GlxA family with amidase domain
MTSLRRLTSLSALVTFEAAARHASFTRAAALKPMETHLQEPLAMRDLSDRLGLSVRQIERLFLCHLNESANRHDMALRMRRARNLLTQTDMAVTDVALACGFTSPSQFSRKYRLHFGQTAVRDRAAA